MQNITSCRGNCESSAKAATGISFYDSTCSCCKPLQYETKQITVVCEDGLEKEADFTEITTCKCGEYKCEAAPSHAGEVQLSSGGEFVDNTRKKKRRRRALSRLFALPP
ncbi:Mucin-5B [Desmophyllum pertusum]|uniref:Mucin-5B n=1 Tax=Desmophyllum pertusum TaxID=174260 RepID=A0A9W9Y9R1_9CNID|nr:Mucin-5B [Desmophyllum pertusum]